MEIKKRYGKGGLYSLLANGGKPDYLDLDKDGDKEELMREAAKQMAGGGRVYRFGGVNKYPHGGVHNNASGPDIQIMAKDSYNTASDPQPGRDFIYLVDGQPTDYSHADVANLLRAEGISGNNLNIRMNEIFTQLPSRGGSDEEERAFREREMGKVLRDIERMEGGAPDGSTQYETGREYMSKKDLGNIARDVARGGRAGGIEYSGRYSPIGQKGTPKNVNTDQFLRALSRNYGN
jgi:hypothetical protein